MFLRNLNFCSYSAPLYSSSILGRSSKLTVYHKFQVSKVQMMTQHKKYSGEEHEVSKIFSFVTETILESHIKSFSK